MAFSAQILAKFKADKAEYQNFRKGMCLLPSSFTLKRTHEREGIEYDLQNGFWATMKDTPEQRIIQVKFKENMKQRLVKKPELLGQMLPDFPPGCRRLTPGPGYLEALTDEKVDVIQTEIAEVDATGIRTIDGTHRSVDAIVCATGFDTTFLPRFSIIGKNSISLAKKWEKLPETYISLATDDFPNYFICLGPNAALGHGSLLLLIEKEIDYITQCVAKIQRDNIRSMVPRAEVVKQFTKHCEQYFERTVYSAKCRSWYKGGKETGNVVAVWPGEYLNSLRTPCLLQHFVD